MITDERPGNAHECTGDDAAGRSGELAGKPGRPSQPVEENAGDNADCENQKKRHDRVGGAHGSDPPHGLEPKYRTSTTRSQEQRQLHPATMRGARAMRMKQLPDWPLSFPARS